MKKPEASHWLPVFLYASGLYFLRNKPPLVKKELGFENFVAVF